VIALRRGSVPEVVVDGVTGFVCDTLDDMVEAVARVDEIDPDDCRRRAADFRADSMAQAYVQVYEGVVARSPRSGQVDAFAPLALSRPFWFRSAPRTLIRALGSPLRVGYRRSIAWTVANTDVMLPFRLTCSVMLLLASLLASADADTGSLA